VSISVINKGARSFKTLKTAVIYLGVTVFCVVFDRVYALFGHGVESNAMLFMFLYPLLGGFVPFLLLWLLYKNIEKNLFYRASLNIYHSGIALLTVGSVLDGIVEIAGASSVYIPYFSYFGIAFLLVGIALYLAGVIMELKKPKA